jgi:hypothetical protein
MAGGMIMVGTQVAQSGTRYFDMELALAVLFSLVLFLIADLDRQQEGLINVSQQAMSELYTWLNRLESSTMVAQHEIKKG